MAQIRNTEIIRLAARLDTSVVKGNERERADERKTDESGSEQILMSYECLGSSQPIVDLDRAFQSRSLRSRGTECSTETRQSKWRRKLRGDRGYVETLRKSAQARRIGEGESPLGELSRNY